MGESKDLKPGDTTSYDINGKTVIMEPVTLGKMKKATQVFLKKDLDSFEMLEEHLLEVLTNGKNKFVTREWIRDNITMPVATRMVEDLRRINGMDVFPKGAAPSAERETRPLDEAARTLSA